MNINPGRLNKKIKIVSYDRETNETTIVHECWASKNNISGTEMIKNGVEFGKDKTRFMIRYTSNEITKDMYVLYGGKKHDIEYINDYNDSHEYIEIICNLPSWE